MECDIFVKEDFFCFGFVLFGFVLFGFVLFGFYFSPIGIVCEWRNTVYGRSDGRRTYTHAQHTRQAIEKKYILIQQVVIIYLTMTHTSHCTFL